ncbi:acyl carrier protein, partial [Streptomyces sp. SID7982]|nr:acyl carrier protein [Streptomyces sp. SID7982]
TMPNTDHTTQHLRTIVATILDLDPNTLDNDQDFITTYHADSLNLIEIIAQIEKHYHTQLPLNEHHHTRTINGLHTLLHTPNTTN